MKHGTQLTYSPLQVVVFAVKSRPTVEMVYAARPMFDLFDAGHT